MPFTDTTYSLPRVKRSRTYQSSSSASNPGITTRTEKLYMATAVIESIIVCGIAFAVFAIVEIRVHVDNAKTKTTPVYLAIFILARLFSCVYSFDALYNHNVVQLCLHIFFEMCMLTYSILEIPQTRNTLQDINMPELCNTLPNGGFDCVGKGSLFHLLQNLMIVPPIIIGLSTIIYVSLVPRLYHEYGWVVFKMVSASPTLKRMHREYQTLISLLKLVTFFATAFCVSYIILVASEEKTKVEFIISIVALPIFLLVLLICSWALRHENNPVMGFCLFMMVVGQAYFIYKFAGMWLPATAQLYVNTKITLALFAIFAIVILSVTFIFGCICMSNFGNGLKEIHRDPLHHRSMLPSITKEHKEKRDGSVYIQQAPLEID